ncbi:MAG: alpha-hydroxy-acid oxidizing protein [Lachnospiraceae bacterium]|nr:alpha-hydroxy-acid oxidizing protein [Lachnospiraceae bacterium]
MASGNGNSNEITRQYLDSLLIETRYMNSTNPDLTMHLFGKTFNSPVMTAALSHLDPIMFEGATRAFAEGAAKAGAILWLGMADEAEVEMCAASGAPMIEIIKPYTDRDLIDQKIRHAEACGLLAVGIDIDHPFGEDGSPDDVDGFTMKAITTQELKAICASTSLPVIAKGVLSTYDAREVMRAGAAGMVLSHHNNRIAYSVPALAALPEIRKITGDDVALFVDGDIRTGMDAFKALALGAAGVCIGRPLMTAIKQNGSDGVAEYLKKVNGELGKAMACTGCTDLGRMDPAVIHRL